MTASPLPAFNALTASAQILKPQRRLTPKYDSWQTELWDYYDRLGEYNDGVSWKANTMSRVRLCAAEVVPGGDEPMRVNTGPAAEAVERLAGGTAGQAQIMKESTIHMSVPGECWLVGEKGIDEDRMISEGLVTDEWWSIRSADEIKVSSKKDQQGRATFEVMDEEQIWRPISGDSIVVRIWDPHPRRGWEANSAGRHARGAMLKVDMLNKRIVATIVSRLAMNGFLLYDSSRLSTPENKGPTEDSETNPDPFAQLMVEVASRAIADPTSAEAIIPIPIGADIGDGENFDPSLLMHHVTFSNPMDEKLMEHRESAIRELARGLDMPADVMLGLADVNHWTAWQIDESGIKIHISPAAETIVHALTKGYLIPTLRAADEPLTGPNGGRLIVWYDTSEITQRPDRSQNIIAAYDRYEADGDALRREIGADESDKPTRAELEDMILKRMAQNPQQAQIVLARLAGQDPPDVTEQDDEGEVEDPPAEEDRPADGPPETSEEPPPPPDEDMRLLASAVQEQVTSRPEFAAIAQAILSQLGVHLGDVDVTDYIAQLPVEEFAAVLESDPDLRQKMQTAMSRRSTLVPAGTAHENRATPKRRRDTQPVG